MTEPLAPCDIVMKGGITSGVVYPPAVVAISKHFHFKNVGGASAGAIAAAASAAAELTRQPGYQPSAEVPVEQTGFDGLGALASEISTPGFLPRLFAPDARHRALWSILEPLLGGFTAESALTAGGRMILRRAEVFIVALALAFGAAWLAESWVVLTLALLLALLLTLAFAVYAFARDLGVAWGGDGFSLCSGMGSGDGGEARGLTPWLTELLDRIAGRAPDGDPLTFGDLWGSPGSKTREDQLANPALRAISLDVMTTNLTNGRPHRIPFDRHTKLFFSEREFRALFPKRVVDFMIRRAAPWPRRAPEQTDGDLFRLPPPWDLPVVVAARMSLSFPLLVAAVPLHVVRIVEGGGAAKQRRFQRIWFSDGGISSNFPIHLYDQLLPRWPTLGISLAYDYPDAENAEPRVRMTKASNRAMARAWNPIDQGVGGQRLNRAAGALVNTMVEWHDAANSALPGFRDRIAVIRLRRSEGGLNLSMTKEQIDTLLRLGKEAGERLVERFASTRPLEKSGLTPWQEHRFTRFRSGAALLEQLLVRLNRGFDQELQTLAHSRRVRRLPYGFASQRQAKSAEQLVSTLAARGHDMDQAEPTKQLAHRQPSPPPLLRVSPRVHG